MGSGSGRAAVRMHTGPLPCTRACPACSGRQPRVSSPCATACPAARQRRPAVGGARGKRAGHRGTCEPRPGAAGCAAMRQAACIQLPALRAHTLRLVWERLVRPRAWRTCLMDGASARLGRCARGGGGARRAAPSPRSLPSSRTASSEPCQSSDPSSPDPSVSSSDTSSSVDVSSSDVSSSNDALSPTSSSDHRSAAAAPERRGPPPPPSRGALLGPVARRGAAPKPPAELRPDV
jgi:hypothetical protein